MNYKCLYILSYRLHAVLLKSNSVYKLINLIWKFTIYYMYHHFQKFLINFWLHPIVSKTLFTSCLFNKLLILINELSMTFLFFNVRLLSVLHGHSFTLTLCQMDSQKYSMTGDWTRDLLHSMPKLYH